MDNNENEIDIDDIIKALPVTEKVPVVALKKLLDEREQIDEQEEKNISDIRLKYQKLIQPLLERASEIIRGGSLKQEEVAGAQNFLKPGENVMKYLRGKIIPDYWVGVFSNSALVDQINQKDQTALKYLIDIQKNYNPEDSESIQLKFIFKQNPFFNETEINRKLVIKNGEYLCLEGDLLTWKQNQCLTHNIKKVTNKKTGEKTSIQGQKIKSFFDIFLNWDKKSPEQLDKAAINLIEISNMIIFDSIDYFLGVINADEESDDEDDEEVGDESQEEERE